MDKLGILLKAGRVKQGLTQTEVSIAMGWGRGCLYAHLENATETGKKKHKRIPRKEAVKELSKLLKLSYRELAEAAIERTLDNKRKLYFGRGE